MDRKNQSPVEVSFNVNGERILMPTELRANPDEFAKLSKAKRSNYILDYINGYTRKVNDAIGEMTEMGYIISATTLKEYLKNGGLRSKTVDDVWSEYLAIMKKRIGIDITPKAAHRYENARDLFYQVVPADTLITKLTKSMMDDFYVTLKNQYQVSTSAMLMTKVQSVIQFAFENGYIKTLPKVKIQREKPTIEYLTDGEMKLIKEATLTDKLSRVRDLFVFQASTGLSYVDMAQIVKEDIQKDGSTLFIQKNRQKTGVQFTSIILPDGLKVLEKYDYELPIISNQKYNDYLKVIGEKCNINKPLHTHLARKTYCTHLLNSGVRMEIVSKCAGHSNTKVTAALYAHLQTETILNEVAKIM